MDAGTAPATSPEQTPSSSVASEPRQPESGAVDEDAKKQRWELFNEQKRQIWTDIQADSGEYDRNLLTLSSGTLALSLAFIKDVVELKRAVHPWVLFCSWFAFAASILITLVSFRLSIAAQEKQLEYARQYYLEGNEKAFSRQSWYSKALAFCNHASGIAFFAGLVLTIIFAVINVVEVVRK